jgi:hypothetical protein
VVITAAIWTGCSSTGSKPAADGDSVKAGESTSTTAAKEEPKKSEPAAAEPAGSGETTPARPARAEATPARAAPAPVGSPEYWAEQIRELEKNLNPLRAIAVPASPAKSRADLVSASLNRG